MGLGVRFRNDNLAFNTFSFRFAFYPVVPEGINMYDLYISGQKLMRPNDFEIKKPEIIDFE